MKRIALPRRAHLLAAMAVVALPGVAAAAAQGAAAAGPELAGVPVDFVLFGLTLVGVALFHHRTLQVAATGLAVISLYKVLFTGFAGGSGVAGLLAHFVHEWVVVVNLFCLLVGFALLADHFERSEVPQALPRFLPDDWKGAFALLAMVFVLSAFLDNIAAALIGGAMAHTVFRKKVHIGYLAAIVACANAGGAGSVVGDTTTTMMWISGVSPLAVLHAFVAAAVALVVCGIPAALQQHKHSPILKDELAGTHIDWGRVAVVGVILAAAVSVNVFVNLNLGERAEAFPYIGVAVWVALLAMVPVRRPTWSLMPAAVRGSLFLLCLVLAATMMPVERLPRRLLADRLRTRFPLLDLRQHPADRARAQAGGLRLGRARLRGRLRRLDDLVRLLGRRRDLEHVPGGEVGRALAEARLARDGRLRRRLLRADRLDGLASDAEAGRRAASMAPLRRPRPPWPRSTEAGARGARPMSVLRTVSERAAAALREFLSLESAGGMLLIGGALAGLVAANTPLAGLYDQLLALPLTIKLGALGVDKPLLLWINDGLMAVFFLLVALELKREMVAGQFSDRRQIALPAACALGGMLVPMAIYAWINRGDADALSGFAIPAATDIAFALGILGLLGSRVPVALKLLLTAIAVLDDLGAIVLIALFYTSDLSWLSLAFAGTALAGLVALNRRGVGGIAPYLALGLVMWLAVLKSGVHATLAGVVLGLTIPMRDPEDPDTSPLERLEHDLHPTVAFAILPIFAFANAGIALGGLSFAALVQPVPLGVALGLFAGKPLGVLGFGALMVALGWARLPEGVNWRGLAGMAVLCGIGFTMSLFIASLAFEASDDNLMLESRLGILAGTIAAAVAGYWVLRGALPKGEAGAEA